MVSRNSSVRLTGPLTRVGTPPPALADTGGDGEGVELGDGLDVGVGDGAGVDVAAGTLVGVWVGVGLVSAKADADVGSEVGRGDPETNSNVAIPPATKRTSVMTAMANKRVGNLDFGLGLGRVAGSGAMGLICSKVWVVKDTVSRLRARWRACSISSAS